MIRILIVIAFSVLLFLQYKLWIDEGAIPAVLSLRKQMQLQDIKLKLLAQQNNKLLAEVNDLKNGKQAIEERARRDLGMIQKNELFYQYLDSVS